MEVHNLMQAECTRGWWKGAGRTKEREVQAWQRRMGFISRWASRPAPDSPAWFTGLQCGNPWFIVAEWRARECCASNPGPYHSCLFHTLPLSETIHKMFSYLSSCLRQFFTYDFPCNEKCKQGKHVAVPIR